MSDLTNDVPAKLQYTDSHEWISDEGNGVFKIGITEHAQQLLGDLVFVELPEVGKTVSQGDEVCVVESVKAASDVYAPINGVIDSINEALVDNPELVNENPYTDGWLYTIKRDESDLLSSLLSAEQYSTRIASED